MCLRGTLIFEERKITQRVGFRKHMTDDITQNNIQQTLTQLHISGLTGNHNRYYTLFEKCGSRQEE